MGSAVSAGRPPFAFLGACAVGLVSAQAAGLQQGFPLREEGAVSVRSLIGVGCLLLFVVGHQRSLSIKDV